MISPPQEPRVPSTPFSGHRPASNSPPPLPLRLTVTERAQQLHHEVLRPAFDRAYQEVADFVRDPSITSLSSGPTPTASDTTEMADQAEVDLDSIIDRLLEVRGSRPGKQVQLLETEIRFLCTKAREIFITQPILLELEAPIKVCPFAIAALPTIQQGTFWLTQ